MYYITKINMFHYTEPYQSKQVTLNILLEIVIQLFIVHFI